MEKIDLTYIQDITDGNQKMIVKLLEVLQKNLEDMPILMRSELENHQVDKLRKTAHKFRSSTASIGVNKLTETLRSIELSIENQDSIHQIEHNIEQVENYAQEINRQVIDKIIEIKLD